MLAALQQHLAAYQHYTEIFKTLNGDSDYLQQGDSAQFAAGILYAWSGQYLDYRSYLVECSQ